MSTGARSPAGPLAPARLVGDRIELVDLETEHAGTLWQIGNDPRIWHYFPRRVTSRHEMTTWVADALRERDAGRALPFVVLQRHGRRIIGETRLVAYQPQHRQIEIAWTWIARPQWQQGYNIESKFLLLRHCFEELETIRVMFTAHTENTRSRRTLESIGATLEGVLRKDRIMPDGRTRDSAYYSVLAEEWPAVKQRTVDLLRQEAAAADPCCTEPVGED